MSALPADPVRHAALVVHAMPRADQEWLLSMLAESARARLLPLLSELRELGIPADARLLPARPAPLPPAIPDALAALGRLDGAQIESLAELLAKEPPGVAATLLALRPWPWAARVRACLGDGPAPWPTPSEAALVAPPEALAHALGVALLQRLPPPKPLVRPRPWMPWRRR